ncbi:MAG: Dot/Icm secretion system protein IcmQ [Legionellaceae bacterium]|nr:Dot/Icm secretion system protein IcmQ [Legionellaceae bacterium]
MKKNKLSEKQVNAVLTSLRELLERGPWSNSAFLRVLGKKLQKGHDDFAERAGRAEQANLHKATEHQKTQEPSETQQEVFIALYASDGGNLESWEKILINLPKQAISRPVYAEKDAIQRVFKQRRNHLNEAYVVMYVARDAILPTPIDKTPKDRFGTELLTLKNKALRLENMIRFVHATGVYMYKKGRLIKMPDANLDG